MAAPPAYSQRREQQKVPSRFGTIGDVANDDYQRERQGCDADGV